MAPKRESNDGWNEVCRRVTCIHPAYGVRMKYGAVICDTSALLKAEAQDLVRALEHKGTTIFITKGVKDEICEAQKHLGTERADEESRRRAQNIADRLVAEERVLDVSTRKKESTLLAFENYRVLYSLSHGLSKTVLHDMVLKNFEGVYSPISSHYSYYERRAQRIGRTAFFIDIEKTVLDDARFAKISDCAIKEVYGEIRGLLDRLRSELLKEREKTLEMISLEFPGSFSYRKCLEIEASRGRAAVPNTDYFFSKLLIYILNRIREGKEYEASKKLYKETAGNTRSTDRKVILAAYALLPKVFPSEQVGVLTTDRDQSELLRLRKAAVVDYNNARAYIP